MTTSLTQTEALDIIFSYKSGLNRRGEMGRDDIFFERDAREGLRAARELSRCVAVTSDSFFKLPTNFSHFPLTSH